MVLTQKEATLIKDLKGQEQLCVDKYSDAFGYTSVQRGQEMFLRNQSSSSKSSALTATALSAALAACLGAPPVSFHRFSRT